MAPEAKANGKAKAKAKVKAKVKAKAKVKVQASSIARSDYRVFVLCPSRREKSHHMFSQTRQSFAAVGCPPSCIKRRQGIDLASGGSAKSNEVCMRYFVESFIPEVREMFDKGKCKSTVVFYAEDCEAVVAAF